MALQLLPVHPPMIRFTFPCWLAILVACDVGCSPLWAAPRFRVKERGYLTVAVALRTTDAGRPERVSQALIQVAKPKLKEIATATLTLSVSGLVDGECSVDSR